jgi:hypothetical protein
MNKKFLNKLILTGTLIVFFTLISPPLAWINLGTDQAQASVAAVSCTIAAIAAVEADNNNLLNVNVSRIYVECSNLPAGFTFFAADTQANGANANRYLALLNTAVALGKPITVYYDLAFTNNPLGCLSNNCRKLTALVLAP